MNKKVSSMRLSLYGYMLMIEMVNGKNVSNPGENTFLVSKKYEMSNLLFDVLKSNFALSATQSVTINVERDDHGS